MRLTQIWTLQGGGWAQEAFAGTKSLDPCSVQAKERSLLWVPSLVAKAGN